MATERTKVIRTNIQSWGEEWLSGLTCVRAQVCSLTLQNKNKQPQDIMSKITDLQKLPKRLILRSK